MRRARLLLLPILFPACLVAHAQQAPAGQLMGFEQEAAQLSPLSPEAIAGVAIQYGQDDDITIVSVRLRALAGAMESAPILKASPI